MIRSLTAARTSSHCLDASAEQPSSGQTITIAIADARCSLALMRYLSALLLIACSTSVPISPDAFPASEAAPACDDGARRCDGDQPQACGEGRWIDNGSPCQAGGCVSGVCST